MFAMGYTLSAWLGFGVYFISASGSSSSFPWVRTEHLCFLRCTSG